MIDLECPVGKEVGNHPPDSPGCTCGRQVSEPKTVEEFASDLAEAASRIGPGKYLLDVLVRMVKTRDEQIRQKERARLETLVHKSSDQVLVAEMEQGVD